MKYLVKCTPSPTLVSPEHVLALTKDSVAWIEARLADGSMDCNYVFPARGGIAIMNAASHEHMMELLFDYPLYPLFTWEIHPLCEWRPAFTTLMEFWQRRAS